VSIPLHPVVRSLILVLLSQALRPTGRKHDFELLPATDQPQVHRALTELLELPSMPSAGHVVALDLQEVGIDLGPIPLDEVLDFRKQHGSMYRAYVRELERFIHEVAALPTDEQIHAINRRREAIADSAADLRKIARQAWARPVSFALCLAGAAWTATTGDLLAALLGFGAAAAGRMAGSTTEVGAYSYLFAAHHQFPPTSS
jgi:hypothetical protein